MFQEVGESLKRVASIFCLLLLAGLASASEDARRIITHYQALRPKAKDLGMYRLDWAESLDVALKRAAKEKRPVCLIIIHAKYGDIASGHC